MKLFESQWEATKTALLEGADLTHNQDGSRNTSKQKMMGLFLRTPAVSLWKLQRLVLPAASIAPLNKVILPVIRRVMPTVIANEIVGVQPMTGPYAQIHTMRVIHGDSSRTVAPLVMKSSRRSTSPSITLAVNGTSTDNTAGVAPGRLPAGTIGGAVSLRLLTRSLAQPARWKAMLVVVSAIQTLRQIVEARTRKLSARWTFEAAQDAQAQQGIDIEEELMAALAQEITAEIDQEILYHLRALANHQRCWHSDLRSANVTGTPTFVGDVHAALAIQVNRAANLIASRTRRGAGNWAVVSPTALTILQSATTSGFARTTEGVFEAPTNTKYVGTLNGTIKVYVDAYASDTTPVVVGYKGSETDAAAFYCPYIPLMSTGVVMDPNTMEPVVSFMTRYGYVELSNTASSLGNAADYVQAINIAAGTPRGSKH
jgi:hypothetical protein